TGSGRAVDGASIQLPTADRVDALLAEAMDALKGGRPDDAESILERVLAAAPGNPEAQLQLGVVYLVTNRVGMARLQFEQLSDARPGDVPLMRRVGAAYVQTAHLREAEPYLERALTAAPDDVEINLLLGQVYSGTGRQEKAIDRFQHVVRLDAA